MAHITGANISKYKLLDMEKCTLDSLIGKQYQHIKDYFDNKFLLNEIMYLYKNSMLAVNLSLDIGQDLACIAKYEEEKQIVLTDMANEKLRMEGK